MRRGCRREALPAQRVAYARAILAQAPRKTAALSLAGPPVKERIVFLTRKQRTSVLCVVLALLLTVTATGCSFAELTARGEDPEAAHQEALKSVLKTDVSLTQEQIDAVNAVFADYELSTDDTLGHFAVNGFFTSTYDDVRELNLKEFLTYFGECGEEDISEEEFAQLKDKWDDFKAGTPGGFPAAHPPVSGVGGRGRPAALRGHRPCRPQGYPGAVLRLYVSGKHRRVL
ncbi:MAG: hypothetical protein ACLUFI_11080 [Oscillospiraceae bacterium]